MTRIQRFGVCSRDLVYHDTTHMSSSEWYNTDIQELASSEVVIVR
jgi:hypothetical protein